MEKISIFVLFFLWLAIHPNVETKDNKRYLRFYNILNNKSWKIRIK